MKLEEKVRLIKRQLKADDRGWFLKVLEGTEEGLSMTQGEVYLTLANPGQVRGNHLHPEANEWFTVVQGQATVLLQDQSTGERLEMVLSGDDPHTLFVPAGVAHAFHNSPTSGGPMLLVAFSDRVYDPADTVSSKLE